MTITDMIEKLQTLRNEHGNLPVTDVAGNRADNVYFDNEDGPTELVYITFALGI